MRRQKQRLAMVVVWLRNFRQTIQTFSVPLPCDWHDMGTQSVMQRLHQQNQPISFLWAVAHTSKWMLFECDRIYLPVMCIILSWRALFNCTILRICCSVFSMQIIHQILKHCKYQSFSWPQFYICWRSWTKLIRLMSRTWWDRRVIKCCKTFTEFF